MTRSSLALLFSLTLVAPAAAQATSPVKIRFAMTAAGAPVTCGANITGVGTTKSTVSILDARFYVSRLRLVKADGGEVP